MPRSLVFGNGNMVVALDNTLQIRDFYYPYVGMEDHTTYGNVHRLGFMASGQFAWMTDHDWEIAAEYEKDSLTGKSTATHHHLGISVIFEDTVSTTGNIFLRRLRIKNLKPHLQEVKVFCHYDFHIYGDKSKDTAQYEPDQNAVLFYRGKRYFLVGGEWENGKQSGLEQYTIGKSKYDNKEGTYRDAEDGFLQGNAVEQGSVDATIGFRKEIDPDQTATLNHWICAGENYQEIDDLHTRISYGGAQRIAKHATQFWQHWAHQKQEDFYDLPPEIEQMYRRSLLIMRTQIDNRGAIIASTDSDIMHSNRDNYTYMWPRDGAQVAMALCEAGYENLPRNFFFFCKDLVTKGGYLLHKYNPDGSLGSSWHPKIKDGQIQLPIQEDESALVLVALKTYMDQFTNYEVLQQLFHPLVLKIGDWLLQYRDDTTGLPLPSYDLWEQDRGVSTTSCAIAGLKAAAEIAAATGHHGSQQRYEKGAQQLTKAMIEYLYSNDTKRFYKSVQLENGRIISRNDAVDASLHYVWKLGVLPADNKMVQTTIAAITEQLPVPGSIGGFARFWGDSYHFDYKTTNHSVHPGNPWIICTLWQAEYFILTAKTKQDLAKPIALLKWAIERANIAGILPEQVHPVSGKPLSVAPLTWSHSTFVSTTKQLLCKIGEILS